MTDHCPICKNNVDKIKFTRHAHDYKHCRICDTLFVVHSLTAKEIYEHYRENYYESHKSGSKQREGYESYFSLQKSMHHSFERKLQLVRQRVRSGSLLDVGAAYGTFLQTAANYYDCTGIEVSRFAAGIARHTYQTRIVNSCIEQTCFPRDQFDVITMWDVIEHLREPVIALSEAGRILKPGGFCFISTDDVNNWLVKLMGDKWWAIAPPLHLCHFSKQSIRIAAQHAAGFDICEIRKDERVYKVNEIIRHFGTSYENHLLLRLGALAERSSIGRMAISVRRPEQFILILRKKT
jgi:SAM-dependent methyltransferase